MLSERRVVYKEVRINLAADVLYAGEPHALLPEGPIMAGVALPGFDLLGRVFQARLVISLIGAQDVKPPRSGYIDCQQHGVLECELVWAKERIVGPIQGWRTLKSLLAIDYTHRLLFYSPSSEVEGVAHKTNRFEALVLPFLIDGVQRVLMCRQYE